MRTLRPSATLSTLLQGTLLACLLSVRVGLAQSLGDVARQERARQQQTNSEPRHVYTNEDLRQILENGDQERLQNQELPAAPILQPVISAATDWPKVPAESQTQVTSFPAEQLPPAGQSLGEVARYYRQQKRLAHSQQPGQKSIVAKSPNNAPAASEEQQAPAASRIVASSRTFGLPVRASAVVTGTLISRSVRATTAAAPASAERVVRVGRQETLWKLARRYLGKGSEWPKIVAANPGLSNPSHILVGQVLRLPAENETVATANPISAPAARPLLRSAKPPHATSLEQQTSTLPLSSSKLRID